MNSANMRATVKVAPTNAKMTSIFVGATFTVALFAQIIYRKNFIEILIKLRNVKIIKYHF